MSSFRHKYWISLALLILTSCGSTPFASKEHYLERGDGFFGQGKFDDAVLQYRKAIQKDSRFAEAHYRLGLAELRRDKRAEALVAFSEAARLAPSHQDAKVQLADLALSDYLANPRRPNDLRETAEKMAAQILALNPGSSAAFRLQGYLAMTDSRPGPAVALFQKSYTLNPNQPDVITALVECLLLDGQVAEAERTALEILDTSGQHWPLYDVLYTHYAGQKRLPEAEAILKSKVVRNPRQSSFIIQLAGHYRRTNNEPGMVKTISDLLARSAEFPQAYLDAGDFYAGIQQWEEAARLYQQGSEQHPYEKAVYQKRIISALLSQRRTAEAAAVLDSLLQQRPDDHEARASRATLRLATGRREEIDRAIADFADLVKAHPEKAPYHFELGRSFRSTSRESEAQAQFMGTLRLEPGHRGALRELAAIHIANERVEPALHFAGRLLEIDPSDPGARLVRTAAWALQGRYGETRVELRRLIAQYPGLREAHLQLALLNLAEKRYSEAEKLFLECYRPGEGDFRALKGLVELHLHRKEPRRAIALVEQELRKFPDVPQLRELLAEAAYQAGYDSFAIEAYEELLAESPDSAALLIALGRLQHRSGNLEKAADAFRKAARISPEDPAPVTFLAACLAEMGQSKEAIAEYRRSLQLGPGNPGVMNNLAFLLADIGADADEALRLARAAAQRLPDQPAIRDTLGYIYLKNGELESALHTFRGLIRSHPNDPAFRYHLGLALLASGNAQAAISELRAALDRNPSPGLRAKVAESLSRAVPRVQ